jgi:PAS domain S-box-containing protein
MPDPFSDPPVMSAAALDYETQRLAALRQYNILDTPPELAFDRITALSARLFAVPIAGISLVDETRVWFKSSYGITAPEIQREVSLSRFALLDDQVLVVLDTHHDRRFANNPLITAKGIRFYAGAPLINQDGFTLGTLCILDTRPRPHFTEAERLNLADLAAMVVDELDLRLAARKMAEVDQALVTITQGVSTETGEAFFQALVQHFTQTLGVNYAFIGLVSGSDPDRVNTLAVCAQGQASENFEYLLPEAPCAQVMQERKLCCYPHGVQEQFPFAPLMESLGIESYAAIPFFDSAGKALGMLGIMDTQPLTNMQLVEALLPIFALRIATELDRQQTDTARQQLQQELEYLVAQNTLELSKTNRQLQQEVRDRKGTEITLRKEREMLRVLLENVQAGIVACDEQGILTLFNQTARDFHGLPATPLPADQWATYYDLYLADGKTPMPKEHIPLFRALQGETVDNAEMVIAPKQGQPRTLLASGQAIADVDGKSLGAVVVMHDITDRKQMENTLRASEAQLISIFQTIPDGILILDSDGHIVIANAAAESILQLSSQDMAGRVYNDPAWEVTTVDGKPMAESDLPFTRVMLSGQPVYNIEQVITHQDGTEAVLCINASPLKDSEGHITHVVAAISDITERKQAEATLQASEERYRSVIETAAEGIVLQQADGQIFTCNASAEEILGLTAEQMMGRTSTDPRWAAIREDGSPFPGEDHPAMVTLRTGEPQTNVVMGVCKPDGSLTWISINSRPLWQPNDPKPFAVVASFFDITDRKRAEAERAQLIQAQAARVKAEAEQFRSAFLVDISTVLTSSLNPVHTLKQVADLIVPFFADWCLIDLLQPEQTIERVAIAHSDPEQVQLGWELERAYPLSIHDAHGVPEVLRSGETQLVPTIAEPALGAIAQSPEHLERLRAMGLKSCIVSPLIARGRTLGAISFITAESKRSYSTADLALAENIAHQVAIATDNAQLYQTEQLARSEAEAANRIKDEFLAVLSHELRSPLNPILGWSQLLQQRSYDNDLFAKGLQTIERNAKLQTQLIADLLDVSRILRGKLSLEVAPVQLQPTLEAAIETVRLAAEAKEIDIQTEFEPNVPDVLGDAGRLQQVVWNLLSNAVKFTPEGGRVIVRLEVVSSAPSTSGESPQAQITVSDTGKGITPEFVPHMFERFRQADSKTTRQFGGLGLGLAIVRQLVELHGGTVQADSAGENQGATFTIRLPLLRHQLKSVLAATPGATPGDDPLPLSDVQILVVEDEADARNLLVFILEQAGATVTAASSAAEALSLLPNLTLDLLISDIGMPTMDGYMLMQQIQAQLGAPGQPLPFKAVALTAYVGEINHDQALAAGFLRHFSKPFEAAELITAIAELTH